MSVIGLADRHYLDDDSVFHASAAGSAQFLGLMVLLVGVILMAVTTFRAGVYPRWAGWCLVAIVVVSLLVQFLDALSTAIRHPTEIYLLVGRARAGGHDHSDGTSRAGRGPGSGCMTHPVPMQTEVATGRPSLGQDRLVAGAADRRLRLRAVLPGERPCGGRELSAARLRGSDRRTAVVNLGLATVWLAAAAVVLLAGPISRVSTAWIGTTFVVQALARHRRAGARRHRGRLTARVERWRRWRCAWLCW